MLPTIIVPTQGAFVKGCKILHGVLIANESLHLREKLSRKRSFIQNDLMIMLLTKRSYIQIREGQSL